VGDEFPLKLPHRAILRAINNYWRAIQVLHVTVSLFSSSTHFSFQIVPNNIFLIAFGSNFLH